MIVNRLFFEVAGVLKHSLVAFTPARQPLNCGAPAKLVSAAGGMRHPATAQPGFFPSGFFNARKTLLPPRWIKKSRFAPGLA